MKRLSLLFIFLLMLNFSGCGKNQLNSNGINNGLPGNPVQTYPAGTLINAAHQQAYNLFIQNFSKNSFRPLTSNVHDFYFYTKTSIFSFGGCSNSNLAYKSTFDRYQNTILPNKYGSNEDQVFSEFSRIASSAKDYLQIGNIHRIILGANEYYDFNLDMPLVGNPVAKVLANGTKAFMLCNRVIQ